MPVMADDPSGGQVSDRNALLDQYQLDDSSFATFDGITRFAAKLCDAPIALINIVEETRQRFMASIGIDGPAPPREISFCVHAMEHGDIMVVPDATCDPRFADNPMVTGPPHIRFYGGAPLVSTDGVPLGSLCIIDTKAREGLTALQRDGLFVLAKAVMNQLEAGRSEYLKRLDRQTIAFALTESEQRFSVLADTMPQMVWSTLPDGYHDYYNARWYEFTGTPVGSTDGEGWNNLFHPDDRDMAWSRWRHSLSSGDPYEIEYRLRHHSGDYRWVLGRALPIHDEQGNITRWFGTCTDIHEQKLLLEQREIIAHELSHRIKNIFSVISGLIGFSARKNPAMAESAEELRERIVALGRAHDFVRPHTAESAGTLDHNSLHGVLAQLFAPYRLNDAERVVVTGEDVQVDDRSATPLALLFHELATNAAKYGALSVPEGHVALHILRGDDDAVTMQWMEYGGPVVSTPDINGFGSQLMELSVIRQLRGTITREWHPDGLRVSLSIPAMAMHRALE